MRVDQWGRTWRKGSFRISLPSGFASDEEERFEISLSDDQSGTHFIEISLSPSDLTDAKSEFNCAMELLYDIGDDGHRVWID